MSVWEPELYCPHCRKTQSTQPCDIHRAENMEEYEEWTCRDCHKAFRWTAELTPSFQTITPEKYNYFAQRLRDVLKGTE